MPYEMQGTDIYELFSMCVAVSSLPKKEIVSHHPKGPGLQNWCDFPGDGSRP